MPEELARDLALIVTGATLTLIASVCVKLIERAFERRDHDAQRERLRVMLSEEVEQIAEMLDVDLRPRQQRLGSGLLEGALLTDLEAPLKRLGDVARNKILFESYSSQLIWFEGYLPNSLVKFYSRLPGYVDRLEHAAKTQDENEWEAERIKAYGHAEALKYDLSQAKKN